MIINSNDFNKNLKFKNEALNKEIKKHLSEKKDGMAMRINYFIDLI